MPEMGWSGKRDADLLRPAARELDAFLTVDRRLPREYELSTFRIAVIVLVARSNRLWTWRVPIAEGAEPIPVPFRVRTELEVGPELAFKYPVDDGARFMVRQIRDAAPSPDGTTLAFAALDRLYVRPLPDGEPRGLTDLDLVEAQPAWSPDGAWIAFVPEADRSRARPSGLPTLTDATPVYQPDRSRAPLLRLGERGPMARPGGRRPRLSIERGRRAAYAGREQAPGAARCRRKLVRDAARPAARPRRGTTRAWRSGCRAG